MGRRDNIRVKAIALHTTNMVLIPGPPEHRQDDARIEPGINSEHGQVEHTFHPSSKLEKKKKLSPHRLKAFYKQNLPKFEYACLC